MSGTTAALAIPATTTGRGVGTSDDVVIAIATDPVGSSGGADSGGIEGVKVSSGGGDPMAFVRSLGNVAALDGSSPALSTSWKPAQPIDGGAGGALPSHAGSIVPTSRPTGAVGASPVVTASAASNSAASAAAMLSTLGLSRLDVSTSTPMHSHLSTSSATTTTATTPTAIPMTGSGGAGSAAFTLVTLDYNQGSALVPGADQIAMPGAAVDLRAQVIDPAAGTYSYSWNTSGLTDATGISGANSYDLTFQWAATIPTAGAQSATLTVTDPNGQQVSQTYTFWAESGTGSTSGNATWPASLDPGLISAGAPAIGSQNVSVVSATGSAETSIAMPSFNPNVAPVSLQYDSLTGNALPIINIEHPLDPTQSTPSTVTAQLTFNGTPGATWTYNTSSLTPGDILQIGLQANASGLSTGRYPYSATVIDNRAGTQTTTTDTGTATIINEALDPTFSALGAGWSVGGLEKIIPASGGVILDQGGGSGEWFGGSFGSGGGTFTSPAGDFSTLVGNSNGTYTRTLTNGTVQTFNASGLETSVVNRNGLTTTFGYSGSLLTSVTDPYGEVSTLAYSGGYLTSITDPAGRSATFTIANGNLTGVTYPDNSV